ncbi:peptidyl-prolyl cis-trans isomerase [Raphidocelis subcapitata]|uniref:peptidylprolyl isomerase n=1 Tax=Raphidocelis subcapitata TaxID=307507 RepID=A0A2V0P628_9CHLO|nr:peptidyl-prolyl cis-trans isomerase [Raphidocelis subcapitata]|eukprot:GBF95318.1 peptidyl-prolyl cis-trans isomerase [Raphidocelis subcapitata]
MAEPSCAIEELSDSPEPPSPSFQTAADAQAAPGSSGGAGGAAASDGAGAAAADDAAGGEAGPPRPPLTPPDDCEAVTEDRGVLKTVLVEGDGERPCLHARCLVNYVGYLADGGELFIDSLADSDAREPVVLVAGRGSSLREVGLQLALQTMRRGERAAVYVTDPAYGYGKQGSFSFPSVPPDAALVYVVTLVAWEPPEEKSDRRGLLFEERLEAAERRRLEGNKLFAEGKLVEALAKYAMSLSFTDEDFLLQLEGPHLDKAAAVMVPVHLNMAAAQIKQGDFHTAIHNCSQVLLRDAENVKALFRRGRARAALGQTTDAIADLEKALRLAPEDKAVLRELHVARQALKQERAAAAKLFRGAFGAPPEPKPDGGASAAGGGGAAVQAGGGGGGAAVQAGGRGGGGGSRGLAAWVLCALWAVLAAVLGWVRRAVARPRVRKAAPAPA